MQVVLKLSWTKKLTDPDDTCLGAVAVSLRRLQTWTVGRAQLWWDVFNWRHWPWRMHSSCQGWQGGIPHDASTPRGFPRFTIRSDGPTLISRRRQHFLPRTGRHMPGRPRRLATRRQRFKITSCRRKSDIARRDGGVGPPAARHCCATERTDDVRRERGACWVARQVRSVMWRATIRRRRSRRQSTQFWR